MNYLLDTHAWLWLFDSPRRLSSKVRNALDKPSEVFGVADISLWEIAQKAFRGHLELTGPVDEWLLRAAENPNIKILPITPRIASEQARLPGNFHKDPADRLIVATARVLGLTLVTRDTLIQEYPHVRTLW